MEEQKGKIMEENVILLKYFPVVRVKRRGGVSRVEMFNLMYKPVRNNTGVA